MLVDNELSREPESADDSQGKQRRRQSKWFVNTKTAAMYAPTVLLLLAVFYVGFGPSPASLVGLGGAAGGAPGSWHLNDAGGLLLARDNTVRLERVSPTAWTEADVGAWLASVSLSHLRAAFRKKRVTGARLLSLDEHDLVRDIQIADEDVAKVLYQVRVLKHVMAHARKWSASTGSIAPGVGQKSVKVFLTGDNMFFDNATGVLHPDGVTPAAVVSLAGVATLRDLVARASTQLRAPVREFAAHNGDLVTDLREVPATVYALLDEQYYVFPTENVGHIHKVPLPSEDKEATVETLSGPTPRVFRIHSFLSKEECAAIVDIARDKMGRSTIAESGDEAKNSVGEARTSSTAWLQKGLDPVVNRIRQRVAELTKLPMSLAEDMQVLHYSKTQHYWAHHDYFDPNIYRGFVTAPGQNRFITVLFYLSDIEKGGETVFPFAGDNRPVTDFSDCSRGVKVTPKAGDAVMFYSMTARRHMDVCPPDDLGCNLDIKSLHGSCDVVTGEKWAANYWVSNKV
mmetsp:Transcript_30185/g.71802  ORF Transcript_30185/g.71802 Transcript_30185/m.71802 type:complete len:514 (+) Transcript_30185:127-1668(+)